MSIVRLIIGVVVGYVLFAMASMMLVVHALGSPGPVTVIGCLIGLAVIGLAAGFIAVAIAGPKGRLASSILAVPIAVATLANLLLQLGAEPVWYKLGTLLLTVTMVLLVGRRKSAEVD